MIFLQLPKSHAIALGTSPLSAADLGISIGLSSIVFMAAEVEKWFIRYQTRKMDTMVGAISEGEFMSGARSSGLDQEEEEKIDKESRRRDPDGIEGLASMFLEEWVRGRGGGGSAHPLTGSDYVALLIENAFAPAELKLAKEPGGRDLLSRYAGELLQEMSERMIGTVEQTMNRQVISVKSSAMVDADCVVSLFKLAGDKAHGKEN